ncbi:MAG: DUF4386 domain-containing protein, partial [Gammaproteobacteria bacterium]|nr:DUF4386 domain-containing protein [Gammaproteobacteria bacterium]
MKKFIKNTSTSNAALIVGIAFISSVIIVSIVDDILLSNFVIPGDTEALARDIEASEKLFGFSVVAYLLVLALDSIIGLALYVVLKSANRNRALMTATLRLLYAGVVAFGIFALVMQIIDVYGYEKIKLVGYIFFSLHILVLGYSIFRSEYIPKTLGVLLIVASFTYVTFFVDFQLSEILQVLIMLTMAIAELSLSIWLILKR